VEGPDVASGTAPRSTAADDVGSRGAVNSENGAGSENGISSRNGIGSETGAGSIAAPPAPEAASPAPAAPGKQKTKRSRRAAVIVLVILLVIAAAVGGVAYFLYTSQFVTTDNAQVDGDKVQINAPATGTLTDWQGVQGADVHTGQILGRIEQQGGFAQPQKIIKSPGNGTIAVNNGVEGQWVTSSTQLATAYDFNKIYVTARVDETDIAGVHIGAPVDISVDAFSGTPITGVVTQIQGAAADQFSLFPEANTDGNFQKVTQVIAVRVTFTNTAGKLVLPGMNVTVHIHKQP
jgi:multidrug resistance efflux pump